MDAFEKFDRIKEMIFERTKAEGFKKSGNSMTRSTEIMKVFVGTQKYKSTRSWSTMFVNIGVFPLNETSIKEFDLAHAKTWNAYPASTRLPSILGRSSRGDEYEFHNDERGPEEIFALDIEPDLQNLFRWIRETTSYESLIESLLTPFRFHYYPAHPNILVLCILKDIDYKQFKDRLNRLVSEDPRYVADIRMRTSFLTPDILPLVDAFWSQEIGSS